MLSGKRIKVIKHAERSDSPAVESETRPGSAGKEPVKTKRDAVSVITEWVSELRRRKSAEAANGFDSLFRKAA